MKRKAVFSVVLVILLSLILCSCGKNSTNLSYDIDTAPINLDPQSAYDYSSKLLINSLFEGLFRSGENGELEKAVCKEYTVSDDGKKYLFMLRNDAKWSDGTDVTADDFVFAFKRLFDPATNSKSVDDFFCILNSKEIFSGEMDNSELGVRALSSYALEIKLSEYNSRFLHLLTTAPAMPCKEEFFLETKGKYGLSEKMICGNGPFYLSAWKDGYLKVSKNIQYNDAKNVRADSVTFNILEENEDKTKRFLDGKTSAVSTDKTMLKELSKNNVISNNENTVFGIVFKNTDSIFANNNIRKALIYGSDYSSMQKALPEYYTKASAIVPSNIRIGEKSYRELAGSNLTVNYDKDKAKALYENGLSDLGVKKITDAVIIIPKGMGHEDYFAYLSQIWQRDLGFYITVQILEQDEYNKRFINGEYDCAVVSLNGDYNSPYAILSQFLSNSDKNVIGFSNAEFDKLLKEAVSYPDENKASENYKKAEQILLTEGVFLPLYYQSEYFVTTKKMSLIRYDFDNKMVDFRMKKKD